ncbi:hypothetical protein VPH35_052063 [Triticum aestivum]
MCVRGEQEKEEALLVCPRGRRRGREQERQVVSAAARVVAEMAGCSSLSAGVPTHYCARGRSCCPWGGGGGGWWSDGCSQGQRLGTLRGVEASGHAPDRSCSSKELLVVRVCLYGRQLQP